MNKVGSLSDPNCPFDLRKINNTWVDRKSGRSKNSSKRADQAISVEGGLVRSESRFLNKSLSERITKSVTCGDEIVGEICKKCQELEVKLTEAIANNPKYGIRYREMKVRPNGDVCIELECELVKTLLTSLKPHKRWFSITSGLIVSVNKDCSPKMNEKITDILSSVAKKHNVESVFFNAGRNSGYGFVYYYGCNDAPDELKTVFPENEMREQFPDYILDLVDECVGKVFPSGKFTLSSMTQWDDNGSIQITVPTNPNNH